MSIVVVTDDRRDFEEKECLICFYPVKKRDMYQVKCNCVYTIHEKCLIQWIRTSPSCPQCRKTITDREILDKSRSSTRTTVKVAGLGALILFAGAAAWSFFHNTT